MTEYSFFGPRGSGSGRSARPLASGRVESLSTRALRLDLDVGRGAWSVGLQDAACRLTQARPVFHIAGLPVDLGEYEAECSIGDEPNHKLGAFTTVKLSYRKRQALDIAYTLRVSRDEPYLIVRVDFANRTGRELTVSRVASVVAAGVTLGDDASQWSLIGDSKRFSEAYRLVRADQAEQFECWWYAAMKSRKSGRSVLVGNVTNHKGLGRFLVLPGTKDSLRLVAYSDYEGVVMPPGARVRGEEVLIHFGRRGTDSLDRFGELIATAHDIDLMKQHPINPYVPETLGLFTALNNYGSAVVRGFDYKHDRSKGPQAFMDPAWTRASRKKLRELGLHHYGFGARGKVRGAPTPLARRYGNPDFWFKEAQKIAAEHPEYYINGRIDFSNPAVQEFERQRVERAFRDTTKIIRYGWDFADRWQKLPGQHDPFMTSAETYHIAMGIWRKAARKHPMGAYAFVWMNSVGMSYDTCDAIHIGADSDQGYYGRGCTFTQGLTRQISGRYFYNGRVWWNSPDSFHVYCGGIYSYQQAKVHASFCAISGNLVHLGEPFPDEDIPEDRLEIIRRVAPITHDVSTAVDLFEHCPARLWNLSVRRAFGEWNVVGLFNVDYGRKGEAITQRVAFEDLGLSPEKDYLVYEFWSRRFLGVLRGGFSRTLEAPDCEVYAIVEKRSHPVLVSTSRHVRHMAYDVLALKWDAATATLSGTSKVVGNDPYQLRVFVPQGYALAQTTAEDLPAKTARVGPILTVDLRPAVDRDLAWSLRFE